MAALAADWVEPATASPGCAGDYLDAARGRAGSFMTAVGHDRKLSHEIDLFHKCHRQIDQMQQLGSDRPKE